VKSLIKSQLTVLPEVATVPVAVLQSIFAGVSVTRLIHIFLYLACVLDGRSCNLQKASQRANKLCGPDHPTQATSAFYSAFKRIFQHGNTETILRGLFVLTVRCLNGLSVAPLELVMDRTNWAFRGNEKNILVIGCVFQGIFIPLVFRDLGRKGNSNLSERKALVNRFLKYWELTELPLPDLFLAGDREFIGAAWWQFLTRKNIEFAFRIKQGQAFHLWCHNTISDDKYKASLLRQALGVPQLSHQEIVILGQYILDLFICKNVTPNAEEKYVYIVTNFKTADNAPQFYRKRWTIEVCFKHLKLNGFDLESTGLQGTHKIELVFGLTAFVYTLCVVRGLIAENAEPPKEKVFFAQNVRKTYKQTSTFTTGYTKTINIVYTFFDFIQLAFQTANLIV
jgi:Transposase DDE domain